MNIEEKVARTILEKSTVVEINGKKYPVKQISVATLIETSRLISEMPWIDSNAENIIAEMLRTARDCRVLGKIAATIILGEKRKKSLLHGWKYRKLSEQVLELTPKELNKLMTRLLSSMEISSFFGLTTSLSEVNLLKPSKEVGKTIVSGQ